MSALTQHEKQLKERLETFSTENHELTKKLSEATSLLSKLQEELTRLDKTHDEELKMRLQFESRLNGLHSSHRDLRAMYDRAVEDILTLESLRTIHKDKIDYQAVELLKLRSSQLENGAQIMF
jgi:chromosome segregation ATPase